MVKEPLIGGGCSDEPVGGPILAAAERDTVNNSGVDTLISN